MRRFSLRNPFAKRIPDEGNAPSAEAAGTKPTAETPEEILERIREEKQTNAARIRAAALKKGLSRLVTKTNAATLALVVFLSIVAVVFLLSMVRQNGGSFTISLGRMDYYRYGIELSEDPSFTSASSRLEAEALTRATNISVMDLPENLDDLDGSHNGKDYIAYTFYVRNNGTADFDYRYQLDIKEVTRNVDAAVRVGMYYNGGSRQIFAKRAADGAAEPGTVTFATDKVIDGGTIMDMNIGSVDKYTIIIWIEGDDPECTDDLLGGVIKMSMTIEVLEQE